MEKVTSEVNVVQLLLPFSNSSSSDIIFNDFKALRQEDDRVEKTAAWHSLPVVGTPPPLVKSLEMRKKNLPGF